MLEAQLYLEVNLLCIVVFAILLVRLVRNPAKGTNQRMFSAVLVCSIVMFLADIVAYLVNGSTTTAGIVINMAANTVYFVLIGLIGYLWYKYSESSQDLGKNTAKTSRVLEAAPFVLLVLVALSTPVTGWFFYLDSNGMYHRGPLHLLQVVVCIGYLLVAAVSALAYARKTTDYDTKHRMYLLSTFCIPVVLCGLAQTALPGVPLLIAGVAVSLLYIYSETRERLISIDELTQVNNRNQLMRHLSQRMNDAEEDDGKRFCLIMLDLDKFKAINDKYGHLEGDAALKRVGAALKQACHGRSAGIFRYGGDEFIVAMTVEGDGDVAEMEQRIDDALFELNEAAGVPYRLTLSKGSAEYEPSMTSPEALIKAADNKLYEAKRAVA